MVDAPERIKTNGLGCYGPVDGCLAAEYVRADLYAALEAENTRLRAELDEATMYTRNLLTAFVGEHFPDNDRWKPLGDLAGMLTQIDNASTIAREYKARIATLEAENERLKRVNNGLHDEVQFMRQAAKEAREALSRTGAVKVDRQRLNMEISKWATDSDLHITIGDVEALNLAILSAIESTPPAISPAVYAKEGR